MQLNILITCSQCPWQALENEVALVKRLREIRMLRREKEPDAESIRQLLPRALQQMACPDCQVMGLTFVEEEFDQDGWQDATLCEVCRKPIPPERLEALPEAKRCAACQSKHEEGVESEEPDFCPKCGSLLVVRVSQGAGVTRYKQFCTGHPACRL